MYKNVFKLISTLFVGLLLVTACNKESEKGATFLDKAAAFHKKLQGIDFAKVRKALGSGGFFKSLPNGVGEIEAFAKLTSDEIKDETRVKATHEALLGGLSLAEVKKHIDHLLTTINSSSDGDAKKFVAAMKSSECDSFLSATAK